MSDAASAATATSAGEDSAKKAKQGAGKRLNDKQRVEIIQIAENSKISKRQLADRYGVSEAAIRKLLLKKDEFLKRYYDTPEEIRDQRLRGKNVRGHELGVGDAGDGFSIGVGGFGASLGAGLAGIGGSANGDTGGAAAAGGAAAGVAGALAVANAYHHTYYARSLYPSDEPWKHGLHAFTGKVTPFLKGFLQSKHAQQQKSNALEAEAVSVTAAGIDTDALAAATTAAAAATAVEGPAGIVGVDASALVTTPTSAESGASMTPTATAASTAATTTPTTASTPTPSLPVSMPLPEDAVAIDWIGFARMLRDIRRAFHRYPETGYQEVRTQAFLKRFCETSLRIPGKNIRTMASTGLVVDVCYENATISPSDKRKLPVLAFRADMDALPIEELNDHLPYCSTHKKQRKDARRRKKRKAGPTAASKSSDTSATPSEGAESTTTDSTPAVANADAGLTESEESGADATVANATDDVTAPAAFSSATTDGDVEMALASDTSPAAPISMTPPPSVTAALDELENSESCGHGYGHGAATSSAAAHMCGHDGHMVMVLGLCALVVRNSHLLPKDTFVRFIFQPAEEGPGGAQKMIEEGALENVDEVYGLHNYPFPLYSMHVRPGPVMAHEVEFSIEIQGVGGHGSAPHKCVDPILTGASVVQALQAVVSRSISPMDTAVLSVTQFRGGDANNVIPSRATLAGTIRVFNMDVAGSIKRRVDEIVASTCAAHGATGRVHFLDGYEPVINPYDETRAVQQVAMEAGLFVSEEGMPLMASEDFAYYLQERKGCYFFLGTKEEGDDDRGRALHSNHYDYNDKATPLGIRVFLGILQSRFGCELYSAEEMQAFTVAMERIALSISVV